MKKLTTILILSSFIYGDILCQSAGESVAESSRAYDNAVDDYEYADTKEEKEEAKEEMEEAKEQLLSATSNIFYHCENSIVLQMGNLLKEKESLEKQVEKLLEENMILELTIKYPNFDVNKIKKYLQQYAEKYGEKEEDKINNKKGVEKIWVEVFSKK